MEIHPSVTGIVALCGALVILGLFAIMDFYTLHRCFSLANISTMPADICTPEHLFRSSLEIAGMAIGLYGVSKVMRP